MTLDLNMHLPSIDREAMLGPVPGAGSETLLIDDNVMHELLIDDAGHVLLID